jgi:hypothetical protein
VRADGQPELRRDDQSDDEPDGEEIDENGGVEVLKARRRKRDRAPVVRIGAAIRRCRRESEFVDQSF